MCRSSEALNVTPSGVRVPGLTPATEIKDAAKATNLIFKRLEKSGANPVREKKPKAEGKASNQVGSSRRTTGIGIRPPFP